MKISAILMAIIAIYIAKIAIISTKNNSNYLASGIKGVAM